MANSIYNSSGNLFRSVVSCVSISILGLGVKDTIAGSLAAFSGSISKGCIGIFRGLTEISLVGRCSFWSSSVHQGMMKYSLLGGVIASTTQSFFNCFDGYRNKNYQRTIKGTVQASIGIVGAIFIMTLPPKKIAVVHESLCITLLSCFSAYKGMKDMANRHYLTGMCKIILGVGGLTSSVYYVYDQLIRNKIDKIPDEVSMFLTNHSSEITQVCNNPKATLIGWNRLGTGVSKVAYSHPELHDYVIKISTSEISIWDHEDNDLIVHVRNAQIARQIVNEYHYTHLVIPESFLITTPECSLVFEKRFYFTSQESEEDIPQQAIAWRQFDAFLAKGHFCDINPDGNHNAGFLKESKEKIGIIDFDCRFENKDS